LGSSRHPRYIFSGFQVAPWQVHLCCVRADNNDVKEFADGLYEKLLTEKIEVIYDDRIVSAGVMFPMKTH